MTRDEYYALHTNCPRCNKNQFQVTTVGIIADDWSNVKDTNRGNCLYCGWNGTVHELIPNKNKQAPEVNVFERSINKGYSPECEKEIEKLTTGGFALTNDMLESPPSHIPNDNGGAYKTELALLRSPERTEKIIWWHEDDPREIPHNHPWDFESTILCGGYTEHRWWLEDGKVVKDTTIYRQGDVNIVPKNVYHVVVDVLPNTTTKLICGKANEGNSWGYLDLETLEHREAEKDPKFFDKLCAINPHMRIVSVLKQLRK